MNFGLFSTRFVILNTFYRKTTGWNRPRTPQRENYGNASLLRDKIRKIFLKLKKENQKISWKKTFSYTCEIQQCHGICGGKTLHRYDLSFLRVKIHLYFTENRVIKKLLGNFRNEFHIRGDFHFKTKYFGTKLNSLIKKKVISVFFWRLLSL